MSYQIPTGLLALIFAAAVAVPAGASDRHHGGALEARQHGYEHGYRDGFHHGREDRDRRAGYNLKNDDYKHADRGYEKFMGDRGDYKNGYREGFQSGYDDAYYGRRGRFGDVFGLGDADRSLPDSDDDIYVNRGYGASDVARDIGYRDGLLDGRNDQTRNHDFRPEGQRAYHDADHGYRSSYGDRDSYRRLYRQGYLQGYEDGYGRLR